MTKIVYIGELGLGLSDYETSFICRAINTYGDGQHPPAMKDTLAGFSVEYIIEVCEEVQKDPDVNDEVIKKATEIIERLGCYV